VATFVATICELHWDDVYPHPQKYCWAFLSNLLSYHRLLEFGCDPPKWCGMLNLVGDEQVTLIQTIFARKLLLLWHSGCYIHPDPVRHRKINCCRWVQG
jgi:hypothetical protein